MPDPVPPGAAPSNAEPSGSVHQYPRLLIESHLDPFGHVNNATHLRRLTKVVFAALTSVLCTGASFCESGQATVDEPLEESCENSRTTPPSDPFFPKECLPLFYPDGAPPPPMAWRPADAGVLGDAGDAGDAGRQP
jgi:hypothetical protein